MSSCCSPVRRSSSSRRPTSARMRAGRRVDAAAGVPPSDQAASAVRRGRPGPHRPLAADRAGREARRTGRSCRRARLPRVQQHPVPLWRRRPRMTQPRLDVARRARYTSRSARPAAAMWTISTSPDSPARSRSCAATMPGRESRTSGSWGRAPGLLRVLTAADLAGHATAAGDPARGAELADLPHPRARSVTPVNRSPLFPSAWRWTLPSRLQVRYEVEATVDPARGARDADALGSAGAR